VYDIYFSIFRLHSYLWRKPAVAITTNYQSTPSAPVQPKVGGSVLTDT
jgi:hypothetical protein